MILQISDILTQTECATIGEVLDADSLWRDGKATAGGAAKAVKANLQADPQIPAVKGVLKKIQMAIEANTVFKAAAQPSRFARLILSRYQSSMEYGDHVDAAYIDGVRADISFTLFLSNPDDYDGGELVIDSAGSTDTIKAPAGSLVLYPSTAVHRVEAVKKGERLACVGWVESRIRSQEHRSVLFDLERTLTADISEKQTRLQLLNIRNNLLRIFGN